MRRTVLALLLSSAVAHADKSDSALVLERPADAVATDRSAADDDAQDRARRRENLREQAELHSTRLRERLRALYKMSNGGSVRMLLSANNLAELSSRSVFVRRLLARDLTELKSLNEEIADLQTEGLSAKPNFRAAATSDTVSDFQRGHLQRPVHGAVVSSFGTFHDAELQVDRARRGVEMRTQAKEIVHAAAAGNVAWIGEVPGIGQVVALDHGGGFITLTGRLAKLAVALHETVHKGDPIGEAMQSSLYFEVSQGGTAIDPVPWMEKLSHANAPTSKQK